MLRRVVQLVAGAIWASIVQITLPLCWRLPPWWHDRWHARFGYRIVRIRFEDQIVYVWTRGGT